MIKLNLKKKVIIGMIHLPPTMSFPGWSGMANFIDKAKKDLLSLQNGGVDAALIENDEDYPCKVVGSPDVVIPMTKVAIELTKISKIPLGVEVLLNDPIASLTIAKVANLSFIRTDYFVDKMYRDGYGKFKINPNEIIAYRKRINGENISILADIQVKYAKMIKQKSISESCLEAEKAGADAVVITGEKTGNKPLVKDLIEAKKVLGIRIPILVGSGFSEENAKELLKYSNGAIVGTSIKTGRYVDKEKVKKLLKSIDTKSSS